MSLLSERYYFVLLHTLFCKEFPNWKCFSLFNFPRAFPYHNAFIYISLNPLPFYDHFGLLRRIGSVRLFRRILLSMASPPSNISYQAGILFRFPVFDRVFVGRL
ncbi:hypothetical protein CEXT_766601 [Caerostris extrusa]|uniref:Uncharacterized protein n=1 Tax=Caerostris extrusa TaxID=172846 RepID=A0AAV4N8V9_CAEEX|nr:hypothetical protein CEXT_766601 [Caerostris extrusa]